MYEVDGWMKHIEEDAYESGCLPETGFTYDGTEHFLDADPRVLIKKLMEFCGTDDESSVLVNSCGQAGRVDIQCIEDIDGAPPSKSEYERWKVGEFRLWAVTYTFYVEHVDRKVEYLFPNAKKVGGFYLDG